MKVSAVFALCFFSFALYSYGQIINSKPLFSSTINPVSSSTNFAITGVIGQYTYNSGEVHDIGSNSVQKPTIIKMIPYNNYTANFSSIINLTPGTVGLLAVDFGNNRVLYYPNINGTNTPVQNATQALATFAFGQASLTDSDGSGPLGDGDILSVDYSNQGVYILSQQTVFFYKWTSVNLALGGALNPDNYFGNCSGCTYAALGDTYDVAVKKSTGEIFVADYGCDRVIVFPPNAGPTTEASYVIGQKDTTQCGASCDNTNSLTTCCPGAYFIVFDSQDNLWVATYTDTSLYFYNVATTQTVAKFVADGSAVSDLFTECQQISMGPAGDSQVMIIADSTQSYVVQLSYNSGLGYPTSSSSSFAFGGTTGPKSFTNDINDLYGGVVLRPPGSVSGNTIFISDYFNNRIVSFMINGTAGSVNPSMTSSVSITPQPGSQSISMSMSRSFTSSASLSSSHLPVSVTFSNTQSVSMTSTMSNSMSLSASSTNSISFGASQSVSMSMSATPVSPSPFSAESSSTNSAVPSTVNAISSSHGSSASSVSSWLSLIF